MLSWLKHRMREGQQRLSASTELRGMEGTEITEAPPTLALTSSGSPGNLGELGADLKAHSWRDARNVLRSL